MRETLFISHAAPEDNDFSIWLASRLQMLGYDVWLDRKSLLGGEKFWQDVDHVIRNKACKVLLVYSNSICQKDESGRQIEGKLKDGLYKECSLAESVAKQHSLNDFILLLNVDQARNNLFIGADRLNKIPFYDNWADGLKQLEKKLIQDNAPKVHKTDDAEFLTWYESQFINPNNITKNKKELYYSNWWPIKLLPEYFYIYQFQKYEQAKTIARQKGSYPIARISNNLSSFEDKTEFVFKRKKEDGTEEELQLSPQEIFKIKILDIFMGFESDRFPNHRDAENHFKNLLSEIFHRLMQNRGMYWYEMANKKNAYYFTLGNLPLQKVKFQFPHRKRGKFKTKNLIGKHKTLGMWHFSISAKPILSPMLAFSLKSHIAFTSNGFNVWMKPSKEGEEKNRPKPDTDKIHSQRRAKGKRMFNEDWRDEFLAFIEALKKNEKIEIPLNDNFILEMPSGPECFWAQFGYFDPKDNTRHGLLATYEFEEDIEEESGQEIMETIIEQK